MLSHAVCQSIRRILAADEDYLAWSRRTVRQFTELRDEHPWVSADATSLVHLPNGQIRWWTFAGGIANTLLADALKPHCDVKGDNLSLSFPTASSLDTVSDLIDGLQSDTVQPMPNIDAMENLKFSECLPPEIATQVFTTRFDDRAAIEQTIGEHRRVIVEN
jgi:ATP-dependent Lhr-like helicase